MLRQVAEVMGQGKAITMAPQGLLLTTQEAADFLGVSRPTLVTLLEEGAIRFDRPSRHRRVRLADLLAYEDRRRLERRAALNQMTEEAQQAGLYETKREDYAAAPTTSTAAAGFGRSSLTWPASAWSSTPASSSRSRS